jgi:CheY-like chemotaxis protein
MTVIATPKFQQYQNLMPTRVRDILLVSSEYHAFILQEDGQLEDQVFLEYKELHLSSAPSFKHVTTGAAALEALREQAHDLVLILARVPDMDVVRFARRVRELRPDQPIVVLAFDTPDVARVQQLVGPGVIDAVFVWSGDAKILLAVIKYIEDRANVDNDITEADVRVIVLVEHRPARYSTFLGALYPVLMRQSRSLFAEGLNRLQKLMRMRTRPKILLATDEARAMALVDRYRDNLIALISEVGYETASGHDARGGIRLARTVRSLQADLPILLLSSHAEVASEAREVSARFLHRRAPALLHDLEQFLRDNLGFGEFVFRKPDGTEVARAADLTAFLGHLRTLPEDCLLYHAEGNHFSNWLLARSEFVAARRIRSRDAAEFPTAEAIRDFIVQILETVLRRAREGVISDMAPGTIDPHSLFQRLGAGSLGGKARGVAFLDQLLTSEAFSGELAGLPVTVPQSVALTTDAFDEFIEHNALQGLLYEPAGDDAAVFERFQAGALPTWVQRGIESIVDQFPFPLAVRSSSLLEDNLLHPFAGIYGTAMLGNAHADRATRVRELGRAIRYVYATTCFRNARAYIANTSRRIEEEKMGVLIQQLVGQRYGDRFYPHFSGVAQSHNYYPIEPQRSADGIVQVVLGLGRMVVEGGRVYRFCPRYPGMNPFFCSPQDILQNSQSFFVALDLARSPGATLAELTSNPVTFPLAAARSDGTLRAVGSVYDAQNDAVVESPDAPGPWVVTFNNVLLHESIPLAAALRELLALSQHAMGTAVEIEFAVDMGDWGRRRQRGQRSRPATLYALQIRPSIVADIIGDAASQSIDPERVLCRSNQTLGHGRYLDLQDVVYVRHDRWDPARSRRVAEEVGILNETLGAAGHRYLLLGPGRWGSSDPWLGVPVEWSQISSAHIIVEASPPGYDVDPSQGTHFFQNITALGIGYLTVPPGASRDRPVTESFVDWSWLDAQPAVTETQYLRHVRTPAPLDIFLDGRESRGVIAR